MKNIITLKSQLVVQRSGAGLGLFTNVDIPKGTFIIEYVGKMLTNDEADRKGGKYLFALGSKFTIDGTSRANIARYINHSCIPNCEPIQYAKRIKIKAKKNIKAGEELLYDYGKEYFNEYIGKHCLCPKHKSKVVSKN
jgi:uncharacterized protein